MAGLHNLKPEKVIRAFEKAGWVSRGQKGSHVKMTKEGNPNILSIPVHKGKTIKIGLLKDQIKKSGLTEEEFLALTQAPIGHVSGQKKGRLTATLEGAKKVSKKELTKIWKKKLLGG